MLHNKRLWFSGLAVAALMVCGQASAFKSGNWNGDANNDDDGKFRDCTMLAEYNSGITLAFIITRDFDWGLVLANDKWNLEVGSMQQVTLAVDSRQPIPSTAKAVDSKGLLISLENTGPVVDAMRHGRMLNVVTDSGAVSFRLTGTRDAIAKLANASAIISRRKRPRAATKLSRHWSRSRRPPAAIPRPKTRTACLRTARRWCLHRTCSRPQASPATR